MNDRANDFMLMCIRSHSPCYDKNFSITTINTIIMKITNCTSNNHQVFTIAILCSLTVSLYCLFFNTFVFRPFFPRKIGNFMRMFFPFVNMPTYLVFLLYILWGSKKMLIFWRNNLPDNAHYAVKTFIQGIMTNPLKVCKIRNFRITKPLFSFESISSH